MSGFSSAWLALREEADHRSRNAGLMAQLAARFEHRETVRVIDLGCGTGSNLRATSLLLPKRQSWTLVDHDAALLAAARDRLMAWADTAEAVGEGLLLTSGPRRIEVAFLQADLVAGLDGVLAAGADLVTAAALFDLCSAPFIKTFAKAVGVSGAAFYTVLTYNGRQSFTPRFALDTAMTAAFHKHQMGDKGFGPSAGPTAPVELFEQFVNAGYSVVEGDSPWLLDVRTGDAGLMTELIAGHAAAVGETGDVAEADIARWLKQKRTALMVGHTDTLAFPEALLEPDADEEG